MRVKVKVSPSSKVASVKKEGDFLKVFVDAAPIKGKANKRLVEILADYFKVPKSCVKILHGKSGKIKLVEVVSRYPLKK
ncbi:MAG: DUF167 domain-containing protein [Elusimicrobia bacterium]|nr:DUF167 domain-containing protein [Elusimicrobiota bacterium]